MTKKLANLVLCSIAVLGLACHQEVRYSIPAQPGHVTAAARACVARCNVRPNSPFGAPPGDRFACYARCPGVRVDEGATCDAPDGKSGEPVARSSCATHSHLQSGRTTVAILGITAGAVLVLLAATYDPRYEFGDATPISAPGSGSRVGHESIERGGARDAPLGW
jgi:hypothetical protein